MSLTRRGLFAITAAAVSARKLPAVVAPPMVLGPSLASWLMPQQTYSNRLASPFVLTRESLQAMRDQIAGMDLFAPGRLDA